MEKEKYSGGSWDNIWISEDTNKQIIFLRKIGYLYFEMTGLYSKFINKYIKNKKNKKYSIIELGCGGSCSLPYIQKKYNNFEIFGIDKSEHGCKSAVNGLDKKISDINIVCDNIYKTSLSSKKFDVVFSLGLIEHFDDTEEILKKHAEFLKKDGVLICIIPNIIGLQGKFFKTMWRKKKSKKGWISGMKIISIEDLNKSLKDIDIKIDKIIPIGGLFPMLLMESYHDETSSLSIKLAYFVYRYLLFLPFVVINAPLLFRINSIKLSPFIVAVGIKK